jgi:hypothetical protein
VAESSGLKFGLVGIHKRCKIIELFDDNNKDALNNLIQNNIAIKVKRAVANDERKLVEEDTWKTVQNK